MNASTPPMMMPCTTSEMMVLLNSKVRNAESRVMPSE
jgi:hypothetical protein